MKSVDDSAPPADVGPLAGAMTSRPPEAPAIPHPRFDRHTAWRSFLLFGSAAVLSLIGCALMADFLWRLGFNGARLLLFGISMGWLPPAVSDQLIRNMADVMLAE